MKTLIALLLVTGSLLTSSVRAQISVISDLSQDREAVPGETYEGTVVIKNDATEPQEFKAYQTDYSFASNGTSTYADPGTTPRSNARWVTYSPSYATIPAGGKVTIVFTVAVPPNTADKELAGTYWSMLMVEGIEKGSAESAHPAKKKQVAMGIRTSLRYGVQIATHIARTGTKTIKFLQTQLLPGPDGTKQLSIDIEDNGTLGFRAEVSVELFNGKGESAGKFSGTKSRMYPGTSVRQTINLGKLPPGSYKALVAVDTGGEDIFGAQYTFEF